MIKIKLNPSKIIVVKTCDIGKNNKEYNIKYVISSNIPLLLPKP